MSGSGTTSDLDRVAAGLAAARDAARADYERKLASYQAALADASARREPLWRKAWAAHHEAESKWRRLEAFCEALGAVAPGA